MADPEAASSTMTTWQTRAALPNKALQRTAADRRGYNPGISTPLSLSYRR